MSLMTQLCAMTQSKFCAPTIWKCCLLKAFMYINSLHIASMLPFFLFRKMKWTETKKLPLRIHGHCVVSENGLVYSIGGKTDDK